MWAFNKESGHLMDKGFKLRRQHERTMFLVLIVDLHTGF